MNIMCIDKRQNNYYINAKSKQLRVLFSENGDLYFCLHNGKRYRKKGEEDYFEINKNYSLLYNIFDELYNNICGNIDPYDYIHKHRSLDTTGLLNKDDIVWHSDDYKVDCGDSMTIKKEKDSYKLVFKRHKDEYEKGPEIIEDFIIRISNSGSRYYPYNSYFMNFYNKLDKIVENGLDNNIGHQKCLK